MWSSCKVLSLLLSFHLPLFFFSKYLCVLASSQVLHRAFFLIGSHERVISRCVFMPCPALSLRPCFLPVLTIHHSSTCLPLCSPCFHDTPVWLLKLWAQSFKRNIVRQSETKRCDLLKATKLFTTAQWWTSADGHKGSKGFFTPKCWTCRN